jgi:hypothetical protein
LQKTFSIALRVSAALTTIMMIPSICLGQTDPGLRGGPPGAGAAVPGIQVNELALFREGMFRATELESVCDGCSDITPGTSNGQDPFLQTITNSSGLGARFNADQCTVCHSQPALGGSGGFFVPNPQDPPGRRRPPENPMFDLIPHRKGGQNRVPSFITQYGPIREVRFVRNPDGTPDGGVHQLFTIVGRTDTGSPACNATILPQPDFETAYRTGNAIFRIPLQLFGLGLIDSIQDIEIMGRAAATAALRAPLGIAGIPNRSANNGTIARFGWKAQNKSITMFAGEAYNVEMGITNELFPQATDETPACSQLKNEPNDVTRTEAADFFSPVHQMADWMAFQLMMRFLDGPQPVALSASAARGQQLFGTGVSSPGIGCFLCHTPQMMTAPRPESETLRNKPVNLYSDLLIHHMGRGLADNVTQGLAKGDMFRTTPLWGVGQRIFFLHDGRTSDLLQAILAHSSNSSSLDTSQVTTDLISLDGGSYQASEASAVIAQFKALSVSDKQAILDFLRSL